MRVVLLFGLAACGRLDFTERSGGRDASTDVSAIGHDEDGDGIPDTSDPCPHVASGGTTDTDGDGVGDACDPEPAAPNQHWVLFATMRAGDTAFDSVAGATQEDDALRFTANSSPVMTMALNRARIDVGWTVHALVGTAQHQVALGVDNNAAAEYYFAELNDNGTTHDAAILSFDGTNGYQFLAQMDPGAFHTGTGYTRLDISTSSKLETGWTGQLYDVAAATPAYIGGTDLRFAFNGVDVSIRYLAIISSN